MAAGKPISIVLHRQDNVAVALVDIKAGDGLGADVFAGQNIPAGHKAALRNIARDQEIIKYGQIIGFASRDIAPGEHVHTHNVYIKETARRYDFSASRRSTDSLQRQDRACFEGYLRADGSVGTRNYFGVAATVSCSGDVAQFIVDAVSKNLLEDFPNIDGAVALSHGGGCCHAPGSEGLEILQRTIMGYAKNPNFGGMLLVGLGCEVNRIEDFLQETGLRENDCFRTLCIQTLGGTKATVDKGLDLAKEMLPAINKNTRQTVSADKLIIGLECGGSDAYSGLTANPVLGEAVDLVIKNGGTAILSETPEIYGAEHLLVKRAATSEVGRRLIERIRWWEQYTATHGAQINNNPTPGNKAGGLTTILEKSMGAIAKAGSTNLNAVYRYAERVDSPGLVFMDSPGYDVVSITGMIAGGANLVCFTTGRGTVCGFRPVPTIKIASNTTMFNHLCEDMDINCGTLLEGQSSIAQKGAELFEEILATASGKETKSERLGFGSTEFVPWQIGAVL